MNIFVGNLLFEATALDIKKLFMSFGEVASVAIAMKRVKGKPQSRGFAFVMMPDEQQANIAIATLNGKAFMGRIIRVNLARPKAEYQRESNTYFSSDFGKRPVSKSDRDYFTNKPGTYRGGRRTRSYMKRKGAIIIQQEAKPQGRTIGRAHIQAKGRMKA